MELRINRARPVISGNFLGAIDLQKLNDNKERINCNTFVKLPTLRETDTTFVFEKRD